MSKQEKLEIIVRAEGYFRDFYSNWAVVRAFNLGKNKGIFEFCG